MLSAAQRVANHKRTRFLNPNDYGWRRFRACHLSYSSKLQNATRRYHCGFIAARVSTPVQRHFANGDWEVIAPQKSIHAV